MSSRGLRDALKSFVPKWLSDRPGLNTGFKVLYTFASLGDALIEAGLEGVRAAWPGKGTPDALPYIGQSRGILQGPLEPNATYNARLLQWLTTWENAGGDEVLVQMIQAYMIGQGSLGLGNLPVVRLVDRAGNWTIANADGTLSYATAAFNWDQSLGWDDGRVHQPGSVVSGYWSDLFLIIAPSTGSAPIYAAYSGTSDPAWTSNFGPAATLGAGFQIPLAVADGIMQIIASFKAAHTWVRAIIWPANSTSFTPASVVVDGTFGDWSKLGAEGQQVVARANGNARFMIPAEGG